MIPHATEVTAETIGKFLEQYHQRDILKFLTCGSVDDGKSTLIGRLLLASGAVYEDQIEALKRDSQRVGTTGEEIDPALLLDGLEDERQQGITIDVAYRYFATPKRKFIIADTPGHEQYTRNMVTGASDADLALILVDARKGLLPQTRRHSFIVSLLGIQHVIVVVNKLDLVDYDEGVFQDICRAYRDFAVRLEIPDIHFVPLSALRGDNVAEISERTPWYDGPSLLHLLETIYVGGDRNYRDFRMPVQWVCRPDLNFRGFAGTVASGILRPGEEVMVLPSRKVSRVRGISTWEGEQEQAFPPQSVMLTLEDEVDVTRGDMLVRPGNQPHLARAADAMVVWMSEEELVPGKAYGCQHTTHRLTAQVESVDYQVNINDLSRKAATRLGLNEIGRCRLTFHEPVAYDAYRRNRRTGSLVLIDRVTHQTVAAVMLLDPHLDDTPHEAWNETTRLRDRRAVTSLVDANRRMEIYGHRPATVLISGLSGAGKTTVAQALEARLFELGCKTLLLDGQNLRLGLSRDLGFARAERSENLRRAAELARIANQGGLICIAAFAAPERDVRERVRELVGSECFLHVHLEASIDACRRRDASGLYAAADRGEISDFVGVSAPFEDPGDAELVLDTEQVVVDDCVERIVELLRTRNIVH